MALALAAFGTGSMLAARLVPRLLDDRPNRPLMIVSAAVLVVTLLGLSVLAVIGGVAWYALLAGWLVIGLGYSTALTRSGRLLKRSAHAEDTPPVYAAQFALSHACWLVAYALAGWMITDYGAGSALAALAALAAFGKAGGTVLWPRDDAGVVTHSTDDSPGDHPHVQDGRVHSHPFVIDDYYLHWPGF